MKKNIKFLIPLFVILFFASNLTEKLFHHSLEKFILSAFQRIDYDSSKFSRRITIIDTSPIYDLTMMGTNRLALADLLEAVKLGEPQIIGLDIRLEPDSSKQGGLSYSLLKKQLAETTNIIVPQGIDPYFEMVDSSKLANVKIYDGYEVPTKNEGSRSLPFQIASQLNYQFQEQKKSLIINYRIRSIDISGTDQLIQATDLLKILFDQSLTDIEKQDMIGMLLASQIVLIGFCNEAINVDQHFTPLGEQPGIIIWANAMSNILNPGECIHYNPWWLMLLWIMITSLVTLLLKSINERHDFFYIPVFMLVAAGQLIFWSLLGIWLYFSFYIYLPLFSFIIISIIAFPIYLQTIRIARILQIITIYPKIHYLPSVLKNSYLKFRQESNPFKQLHLSFTLIEECIKFSALFGLAQAMSVNANLNNAIGKLKWDRQRFSRLTFGEWQNIMRSLILEFQDNPDFLEEWKMIYLEKNDSGKFEKNRLWISIDDDLNVITEIESKATEMNSLLENLQRKSGWSSHLSYFTLKMRTWKPFRQFIKLFYNDASLLAAEIIERRFGDVKHLIQLRNRLVHSGGVFMDNAEYHEIQPKFKRWLEQFLFEKFKFWRDVKLVQELYQGIIELNLKLGERNYKLTPFFLQAMCDDHLKEELFLLSVIDDKNETLTYEGNEQTCRLVVKNATEKCNAIFSFLGIG